MTFNGFGLEHGDNSKEAQAICLYTNYYKIPRRSFRKPEEVPKGWIAYGSVKWTDRVLGSVTVPDYYPAFLAPWIKRKVWQQDKWPVGHTVFIKPADCHKRFNGFITTGTWKGKKRGPYWCSEIVQFVNEWRYYIAWGEVVASKWCCGAEESNAPVLSIDWPKNFCGCVDFGTYPNGDVALVESNSPYACGWYGTLMEYKVYSEWIAEGWKYMLNIKKNYIDKTII
jgi:hypothetical protein